VYEVFDSASPLELNPEVVTLTPGTPCISDWIAIRERGSREIKVTIFTPKIKLLTDIPY
jgi:hypothetical protein